MTNNNGYTGKILRVDLPSGSTSHMLTADYADLFLGGRGIAAKIYWDEVPPSVNAFDPENKLIFMTGPVCGVSGFGSRFQVCGKSASTNTFSYSNLGGSWGAHLKLAGYDGLVVQGKADRPVYLWIDGDRVDIRDAAHLKGLSTFTRERKIREELGESVRVLTIGPAGDNMVSFATLVASDDSVGSGGLAAVMGSKNLMAIAVKGHKKVAVADRDRVLKLRTRIREMSPAFTEATIAMGLLTPAGRLKKSLCHGCLTGCVRATYKNPDGDERKFMCQAALF